MGIFSRCIVFPCLKKKKKTQNGLNIFELFLMTYKHLPLNYALNIVILLKTLKQAGDGSPASITITSISGSISSFLTCSFLRQRENFQGKEDPRIILLQDLFKSIILLLLSCGVNYRSFMKNIFFFSLHLSQVCSKFDCQVS